MINQKAEGVFYTPLVWSLASALLVSGAALAILMISAVLGAFRFVDLTTGGAQVAFGLWLRGNVGDMATPASMKRIVAWRDVAPVDVPFRESRTLDRLTEEGVAVLAIPDARSLSRSEAVDLRRFLMNGGGVVLTGSIGVMDDAGEWRGYELMQNLLDVESVVTLPIGDAGAVIAGRRGPLASDLKVDERLELIAEPGVPAIANPDAEIQWIPGAENATPNRVVDASKRIEVGRGRLVWLGMGPESAVQRGAEDWRAMVRLVRSAAAWAGRRSQTEVLLWPKGADFAAVIQSESSATQADPMNASGTRPAERLDRIHQAEISGGVAILPATTSEDVSALQRHLAQRGAWIAQQDELSQWRESRNRVSTRTEQVGSQRLLVAISNRNEAPIGDVVVRVHLGHRATGVEVRGTTIGQQVPQIRFESGRAYVDLALPPLAAGGNRAFTVDFDKLPLH